MYGKFSKGRAYYACAPKKDTNARSPWYEARPKCVWIGAGILDSLVHSFFSERVFGPDRRVLLEKALCERAERPAPTETERKGRLPAAITDNEKRKSALVRQLATPDDEGDDPGLAARFRQSIKASYMALDDEGQRLRAELGALVQGREATQTEQSVDLLDALPQLRLRLPETPEQLQRALYDASISKSGSTGHTDWSL